MNQPDPNEKIIDAIVGEVETQAQIDAFNPQQCAGCSLLLRCMGRGRVAFPATDRHNAHVLIFVCQRCKQSILEEQSGSILGREIYMYQQTKLDKLPPCWDPQRVANGLFQCDQCDKIEKYQRMF